MHGCICHTWPKSAFWHSPPVEMFPQSCHMYRFVNNANCFCNNGRDNFLNVRSSASNRSVTFSFSLSNSDLGRSPSLLYIWLPPPLWCRRHPRRRRHYSHRRIRRHIPLPASLHPARRRRRRWYNHSKANEE